MIDNLMTGEWHDVKKLEELCAVAREILRFLGRLPSTVQATVVTLSGELGAGKTAFTKQAARLLGITETITSPTFILEKIYTIVDGAPVQSRFARLIHIDAYRLNGAEDLKALDFENILADPKNLVFIEWPERVASGIPRVAAELIFEHVNETMRRVRLVS